MGLMKPKVGGEDRSVSIQSNEIVRTPTNAPTVATNGPVNIDLTRLSYEQCYELIEDILDETADLDILTRLQAFEVCKRIRDYAEMRQAKRIGVH